MRLLPPPADAASAPPAVRTGRGGRAAALALALLGGGHAGVAQPVSTDAPYRLVGVAARLATPPASAGGAFRLTPRPAPSVRARGGDFALAGPGPQPTTATTTTGCDCLCGTIFTDGFESGDTSAWSAAAP